MNLLDKIKSEPLYEAPTGWVKYKEAYFILIDEKQYPKRKAIEYIAKEEGLSPDEENRLYMASKSWKKP